MFPCISDVAYALYLPYNLFFIVSVSDTMKNKCYGKCKACSTSEILGNVFNDWGAIDNGIHK